MRSSILPLVTLLFLVGCSRTTDLSGAVFLSLASGDVVRAAGVEVFLIRATPELVAVWNESVQNYRNEYAPIGSRIRAAMLSGGLGDDGTSEASRLVEKYEQWAEKELPRVATDRAVTDASGEFRFASVPRGRVFLFVKWQTSRWLKYWMVEENLKGATQRVSLGQVNVWPIDRSSAIYGTTR